MANAIERLERWSVWMRTGKFAPGRVSAERPSVTVDLEELELLLKVVQGVETLRRALPDYEIHGDEVVAEERELFELAAPLFRDEPDETDEAGEAPA